MVITINFVIINSEINMLNTFNKLGVAVESAAARGSEWLAKNIMPLQLGGKLTMEKYQAIKEYQTKHKRLI